jgi:hypothetical protein
VKSSLLGSVLFYTYENLFDITKNEISNFSSLTFKKSIIIADLNNEKSKLTSKSENKIDDNGVNNDNVSSDKNKSLSIGDMAIGDTNRNRVMDEDGHSFACVLTAAVAVGAFGGMSLCICILMHMNVYMYMYIYMHVCIYV